MSDFQTAVGNLARYIHNPGDTAAVAECMVMALKGLRGERSEWAEGSFGFVVEPGVSEYPFGSYPGLPGDLMSFLVTPRMSYAAPTGAILEPDTLVSSTNLTGVLADVQDSAELPDEDYLDPTTAANTSFEVSWDVALSRPLLPGAGKQIMRVAAYCEGTSRVVAWTVKEGGSTVATGTFTVASTTPTAYHVEWDAAKLSTLNPAAGEISLLLADSTGAGEVHFGAVQWFTGTRITSASLGGMRSLIQMQTQELRDYSSNSTDLDAPGPTAWAIWNRRLVLDPAPSAAYYIQADYQKDSTRDRTTGALLTTASTTETNDWLDGAGYQHLLTKTLQIYYRLRPHDAKAAALADDVAGMAEAANDLAAGLEAFSGPPRGWL